MAYAPVRSIQDRLSARGVVLLGSGDPIVLCAVDWIAIGNTGHDVWRERLASAAGTTADRVAVHTLHQHDGPRCDFSTEDLLEAHGYGGKLFDSLFARQTIDRVAAAIGEALKAPREVTHLGVGTAKVEKVASNRRILGSDGKVKIVRWSKSTDPEAIAAPEGVIDPLLRTISFWDGDRPIACLTYYATHPQSYYGKGDVTAEFVGLARAKREKTLDGLPHIHFNGAGGNVTAGKYNDGSPEMRPVLTQRMADGMRRSWEATERVPVKAADIQWRVTKVSLPLAKHIDPKKQQAILADKNSSMTDRMRAARALVFAHRIQAGHQTELSCLRIQHVYILHMPGELFVEYQLAAQAMRPEDTVCMAAYGDCGPLYIGTEIAYSQGGYETSPRSSLVSPTVEKTLTDGMRKLLE